MMFINAIRRYWNALMLGIVALLCPTTALAISDNYTDDGGGTYWGSVVVSSTNEGHSYSWWTGEDENAAMERFRGFTSEHNGTVSTEYPTITFKFKYHEGQRKDFKFTDSHQDFYVRLTNGTMSKIGELKSDSWSLQTTDYRYGRLGACQHDDNWITLTFVPNNEGLIYVNGFQVESVTNYKQSNFWTANGLITIKATYLKDLVMAPARARVPVIEWREPGKVRVSASNDWLPATIGNGVQNFEFACIYDVSIRTADSNQAFATSSLRVAGRGSGEVELAVPQDRDFTVHVARTQTTGFLFENNTVSQTDYTTHITDTLLYNTPPTLRAAFNQVSGEVRLQWDDQGKAAAAQGDYKVYRTAMSDDTYSGNRELLGSTAGNSLIDNRERNLEFNKSYRYEVFRCNKSWGDYSVPSSPETSIPAAVSSSIVSTAPCVPMHLVQDTGETDNIKFDWEFGNIPNVENDLVFKVHRIEPDGSVTRNYMDVTVPRKSGKASFTDTKPADNCTVYGYFVQLDILSNTVHLYSDTVNAHVLAGTTVTSLTVSKGTNAGSVQLNWRVKQVGSEPSLFELQRRFIGAGEWMNIHQVEGTSSTYSFTDNNVEPGRYYEYRVVAYGVDCEGGGRVINNAMSDTGFGQVSGVVSGHVEYETGTAVDDVVVTLTREGDESVRSQFYSRHIVEGGEGVTWQPAVADARKIFAPDKPWSLQLWFNIDDEWLQSGETGISIANIVGVGELHTTTELAEGDSVFVCWTPRHSGVTAGSSAVKVKRAVFNHITVSHDGKGGFTLRTVADGKVQSASTSVSGGDFTLIDNNGAAAIVIGGEAPAIDGVEQSGMAPFVGFVDEVRIWNRALSDSDVLGNHDRLLSGRETGLKAYWTFDEGLEEYAYDGSFTNGVPNNNHPAIGNNTRPSDITPTAQQLSLYGRTNDKGEYEIRGIPFTGSGTRYSVVPVKGTHDFSPKNRSAFISSSALTINNADFTDVSSVRVRGTIRYAGTTIPADSVTFYVDGSPCSKNGKLIYSNANGEYEISVPIGEHFIEARREGHTFVDGGRYPAGDGAFNFTEEANVDFTDHTLVVLAGRVTGGNTEGKKPLGYGRSVNTIGKATIKLSAVDHPQRMINAVERVSGTTREWVPNPATIEVVSTEPVIKSTAYRGGGDVDEAKFIYISTDEKTGEFCALVPPLRYRVESVKFDKNHEVEKGDVFKTIPVINISNPLDSVRPDTVYTTVGHQPLPLFKCNSKLILTYRSNPVLDISQVTPQAPEGIFGTDTLKVSYAGEEFKFAVYETDKLSNKTVYNYSYPIFEQGRIYEFKVKAYEPYTNRDGDEPKLFKDVLADSTVLFNNEIGSMAQVAAEDATKEGQSISRGDMMQCEDSKVKLDANGEGTYRWTVGMPSLTSPYTRSINASMTIQGETKLWRTEGLQSIVSGVVPLGNNFITAGPSYVQMVLRDPPGDASNATWETDTVHTSYSYHARGIHQNTDIGVTFSSGVTTAVGTGIGVFVLVNTDLVHENGGLWKYEVNKTWDNRSYVTYTNSHAVSTSNSNQYVGRDGDVFVGYSTNYIIGPAERVGIWKDGNGEWGIRKTEVVNVGEKFNTVFNYSQKYIENTLISNIMRTRNAMLTPVKDKSEILDNPSKPMYYTILDPIDPRYGSSNDNADIWGAAAERDPEADSQPSYYFRVPDGYVGCDSIKWCNEIIKQWQKTLADNEEDKLNAFSNEAKYKKFNKSFETGSSVTDTDVTTRREQHNSVQNFTTTIGYRGKNGLRINKVGFVLNTDVSIGYHETIGDVKEDTYQAKYSYTLNDTQRSNAHTVDIYNSPKGWGPIFRTRAGQTRCPFEDETRTKYYRPGTLLDYATLKVDNPKITMPVRQMTNIPAGQKANFQIVLANESETRDPLTNITIYVDPASNPKGLNIDMDGEPMATPTELWLEYGVKTVKTLTVSQSDNSVLDYDDIKIILHSPCLPLDVFDTETFSAHFVPAAPPVTMELNKTIINHKDIAGGDELQVTIKDINRLFTGLKGVRLKYRFAGDSRWITAHEWFTDASYMPDGENDTQSLLLDESSIDYTLRLPDIDGNYVVMAECMAMFGDKEVLNATKEVTVVRDTHGPKLLGQAMPNSGFLHATDDIHIRFNEAIRDSYLTKDGNFMITGALNDAAVCHEVALQLNGEVLDTEAYLPIHNTDFSAAFWIKRQGAGTMLRHGTDVNYFALGVDEAGHATLDVNGEVSTSTAVIPVDKWVYVGLSYTNGGDGLVNAFVAEDATTTVLFDRRSVPAYSGEGRVALGEGLSGAMSNLSLWNKVMTQADLLENKNSTLAPYTPGLIGYWKMDEGHGTVVTDLARGRNIYLDAESWNIDNTNYAASLDGSHSLKADISTMNNRSTDSYVVEMWFRPDKGMNSGKTLFSVTDRFAVGFGDEGNLMLRTFSPDELPSTTTDGVPYVLTTANLDDGAWHHLAMNVRRGVSAQFLVDGETVRTIAEADVPVPAGDFLYVGSMLRGTDGSLAETQFFTGDIDEVRIWSTATDALTIASNRYAMVDTARVSGLYAYYPMQHSRLDGVGNVVTEFSLENRKSPTASTAVNDGIAQAVTAPPLRSVPDERNLNFDYTASANEIYITLNELPGRLHGNRVTFRVKNVRDIADNLSEDVVWSAIADYNDLEWTAATVPLDKSRLDDAVLTNELRNVGNKPRSFTIAGLPSWIKATPATGSLQPGASATIRFDVDATAPLGSRDVLAYARNDDDIYTPFHIDLYVYGNQPDWSVDASQFESTMNIIGQIYIDDKLMQNTDTRIAAFVGEECRGVASPSLIASRDAYYVTMAVYGHDTGDEHTPISFRIYDANTGTTYGDVNISEGEDIVTTYFAPNTILGSYDKPVEWHADVSLLQELKLEAGWNWISFYLDPNDPTLEGIFGHDRAFKNVTSKASGFGMCDGTGWQTTLDYLTSGEMYKVRVTKPVDVLVHGFAINPALTFLTMHQGWNWIGSVSTFNLSVAEAFADLNPSVDDAVKNKTSISIFNGTQWEGTMQTIVPGEGYYYQNKGETRVFHYPNITAGTMRAPSVESSPAQALWSPFTPVDHHRYSDNMNVVARLMDDAAPVDTACVAAFVGGECRGVARALSSGLYFITIAGNSEENGEAVSFRTWVDGEELPIKETIPFAVDVISGELSSPTLLHINTTGIDDILIDNNVVSVQYINAAGITSDAPFEGFNIVVVTYTDGTTLTTKVVK